MKCIVPLAGPDIFTLKYGLKPAYEIDGEPLFSRALHSRSWFGKSLNEEDLIFVLRNFKQLKRLQQLITTYFPHSRKVIISDITRGALMSSLSGAALLTDFEEIIAVDLVDIMFSGELDPVTMFNEDQSILGLIPFFKSENSKYSYLKLDKNKNVLRTREKEVISNNASAGVYFFRNLSTFLSSIKFSIANLKTISHNDLLFLCPSFNGLNKGGNRVKAIEVNVYNEISLSF